MSRSKLTQTQYSDDAKEIVQHGFEFCK